MSQLTTGYRGNRNWRDMSEYAVHFTKIEAKIERALERGTDRRVQIVRTVRRAYTLATEYPRRKIGARSVAGERIIFARPGPELEYWEGED